MKEDNLLIRDYRGRLQREPILDHTPPAWGAEQPRREPSNSIPHDADDPRPDQRVDSAGYQRWRLRQLARHKHEMQCGYTEHAIHIPERR